MVENIAKASPSTHETGLKVISLQNRRYFIVQKELTMLEMGTLNKCIRNNGLKGSKSSHLKMLTNLMQS